MSEYHLAQELIDGSDDPRVARLIEQRRRLHLAECPGCDCEHRVTVETIRTATAVEDVDGAPLGVTETTRPMIGHVFTRRTE